MKHKTSIHRLHSQDMRGSFKYGHSCAMELQLRVRKGNGSDKPDPIYETAYRYDMERKEVRTHHAQPTWEERYQAIIAIAKTKGEPIQDPQDYKCQITYTYNTPMRFKSVGARKPKVSKREKKQFVNK